MEHKREREIPPERISWRVHERDLCRLASAYQTAIIVLVLALVFAVVFAGYEAWLRHKEQEKWLDYLEQYDFESYDYTQDGQGLNIIGNSNGVDYNVPAVEGTSSDQEEPRDSQGQGAEKGQKEMSRENESEE